MPSRDISNYTIPDVQEMIRRQQQAMQRHMPPEPAVMPSEPYTIRYSEYRLAGHHPWEYPSAEQRMREEQEREDRRRREHMLRQEAEAEQLRRESEFYYGNSSYLLDPTTETVTITPRDHEVERDRYARMYRRMMDMYPEYFNPPVNREVKLKARMTPRLTAKRKVSNEQVTQEEPYSGLGRALREG